jgi:hypothetical protein
LVASRLSANATVTVPPPLLDTVIDFEVKLKALTVKLLPAPTGAQRVSSSDAKTSVDPEATWIVVASPTTNGLDVSATPSTLTATSISASSSPPPPQPANTTPHSAAPNQRVCAFQPMYHSLPVERLAPGICPAN